MKGLLYAAILYFFIVDALANTPTTIPKIEITLPLPTSKKTPRNYYIEELLTSIFAKEDFNVKLQYSKARMNQLRISKSLVNREHIDLAWLPYTTERAMELLAIEIPLYKGLHGTRLLIINKNNLKEFKGITTLNQLSNLVGVQHHSWTDYEVLVKNKLRIKGDLSYSAMFKAVSSGLSDYFSRSALTIHDELKNNKDSQLTIEPNLVLKYPSYINFFVSKKSPKLAKLIQSGMKKIIADGSFEKIFNKYYDQKIRVLNLAERHKLELKNESIKVQ